MGQIIACVSAFCLQWNRDSAWWHACASYLPPLAGKLPSDRAELKLQTSTFLTPVACPHPRRRGLISTSIVYANCCPVTNSGWRVDLVHLLPDHRHKGADVQTPPLEDPTPNTACFTTFLTLTRKLKSPWEQRHQQTCFKWPSQTQTF